MRKSPAETLCGADSGLDRSGEDGHGFAENAILLLQLGVTAEDVLLLRSRGRILWPNLNRGGTGGEGVGWLGAPWQPDRSIDTSNF